MADYGDHIILDIAQQLPELEANKNNFLKNWPPSLALFLTKLNPSNLGNISLNSIAPEKQHPLAPQTSLHRW